MQSIYSKTTETEYLWQGDAAYWSGRAYNLFPIIGRMYKNTYTYAGNNYSLLCHGIARYRSFHLADRTATKLVFQPYGRRGLAESLSLPLCFYHLLRNQRRQNWKSPTKWKTPTRRNLFSALGGHPGFNVPFAHGNFENYYLEFTEQTRVALHTLSEKKFMTGETLPAASHERHAPALAARVVR